MVTKNSQNLPARRHDFYDNLVYCALTLKVIFSLLYIYCNVFMVNYKEKYQKGIHAVCYKLKLFAFFQNITKIHQKCVLYT